MKFKLYKSLLALTIIVTCLPDASFAQTDASREQLLKKADDPEIVRKATIGTTQKLVVTLDTTKEIAAIRQKHYAQHMARASSSSAPVSESLSDAEEAELVTESKEETDRIKQSVFSNGYSGRSRVLEDFSHSPVFVIEITDIDALLELLRNPKVKAVSSIKSVRPLGSQNLSLIGQPVVASSGR